MHAPRHASCALGPFGENPHEPRSTQEITPGNYQILFAVDEAERRALSWLVGAIQRGVLDLGRGLTARHLQNTGSPFTSIFFKLNSWTIR